MDLMDYSLFTCSLCSYCCNTRLTLSKHTFETHSVEPTFHFVCSIKGCLHSFKYGSTYSSFKTHASRKHPNWKQCLSAETGSTPSQDTMPEYEDPPVTLQEDITEIGDVSGGRSDAILISTTADSAVSISPASSIAQRTAAMFLLTFQERYQVPQIAINFAVGSISTIVDGVCESIKCSLEAGSCSIDMSAFDEREDPFASLGTEYMQSKFYRDVFGLVVSCTLDKECVG